MYKKYADKWIKALRSGNYQQGKGSLCNDNKFCCLGVLCDIVTEDFDVSKTDVSPYGIKYSFKGTSSLHCIPQELIFKLGIKDIDPMIPLPETIDKHSNFVRDGDICLSSLNDRFEFDFNQIADLIEKHYKEI